MVSPTSKILRDEWLKISAESPAHQDVWLCEETILRAINALYETPPNAPKFTRRAINTALSNIAGTFDKTNIKGFYHIQFATECPYNAERRVVHYYYSHVHNNPPSKPQIASDVEDIVARSTRAINNRERIPAKENNRNNNDNIGEAIERLEADNKKKERSKTQKQEQKDSADDGENVSSKKEKEKPTSSNSGAISAVDGENCGGGDGGSGGEPSNNIAPSPEKDDNEKNVYWQSPEAKQLFGFSGEDVGVVEGLHERINLLKQVLENEEGYQLVIPMTEDSSLGLSSYDKFAIRN